MLLHQVHHRQAAVADSADRVAVHQVWDFRHKSAGKAFKLTDSSGNGIVTYVPSKQYSWVLVSTPEMSSGTYTLNYGGSVTGGTFTNGNYGLVTDGTYSGSSTISLSAKQ